MYLNVPQVNDIIYCDGCASDNSSQGALFLAAFEAKASLVGALFLYILVAN
jgi:hypothetical protein